MGALAERILFCRRSSYMAGKRGVAPSGLRSYNEAHEHRQEVIMALPEEFQKRMKEMLGAEYEDFITGYEQPRKYGLRVNTLKLLPEEFEKIAPF